MALNTAVITILDVRDIRFPTSLQKDGSDAMNKAPDYSCPYVVLKTDGNLEGHGITFTVGKGNDIVVSAIKALSKLVIGKKLSDIFGNFGSFWRHLTSEDQMRWIGPEKGVVHLAVAAVVNALWDLWAKIEEKPLWKLLVDMEPEQLLSTIDFRYMEDTLTKQEALEILNNMKSKKTHAEAEILERGYPAYTTSCGWLGYDDEKIRTVYTHDIDDEIVTAVCSHTAADCIYILSPPCIDIGLTYLTLCRKALSEGFTMFKVKVGADLQDDIRRCQIVREEIGADNILMTDANQRWETNEAIEWMKKLAKFDIHWIEEPTSPDDIMGHSQIATELNQLGIGVATGEQCHNRIMFKQFLKSNALQFCQIDACRHGGVNECLAVILMAAKYKVPICPHGGGVGLCELIQHLSIFDYIAVTGTLDNRVIEYVDHLHEHFINPVVMKDGHYQLPQTPGYSIDMKQASLDKHEYPNGSLWQQLFKEGVYKME